MSSNHRKSYGALDGGDSMDMTSIDASTSTIRSSLKGSRVAKRVSPLDLDSVGPALNAFVGGQGNNRGGLKQTNREGTRAPGRTTGNHENHTNFRSGAEASHIGGNIGSRREDGGSKSISVGHSRGLSNDLYGFVGMDVESHKPRVAEPKRNRDRDRDRVQPQKWVSTSPSGQIEADLTKVTAIIAASDEKSAAVSHRKKITRQVSGPENAANKSPEEDRASAKNKKRE